MSLSYWPRYLLSILMWIGTGVVRLEVSVMGVLELSSSDHLHVYYISLIIC